MTQSLSLRKPKLHFDTAARPTHVTFDDGKEVRRNIPWLQYVEASWPYNECDVLKVQIGAWMVVLHGHNLGPLFLAIEDQTLVRVRAQPELANEREREADTFVAKLCFDKASPKPLGMERPGQVEFDLRGG